MEEILKWIGDWALSFAASNPAVAGVLMFLMMVRGVMKPLMTALHIYVEWTPYDSDNKWLASVESSKTYKLVVYLLDWLLSVKLGKK